MQSQRHHKGTGSDFNPNTLFVKIVFFLLTFGSVNSLKKLTNVVQCKHLPGKDGMS